MYGKICLWKWHCILIPDCIICAMSSQWHTKKTLFQPFQPAKFQFVRHCKQNTLNWIFIVFRWLPFQLLPLPRFFNLLPQSFLLPPSIQLLRRHLTSFLLLLQKRLWVNHQQHILFNTSYDLSFPCEVSTLIPVLKVCAEFSEWGPPCRIQMRVIRVSDHLVVGTVGDYPLVLTVFDLETVHELRLKLVWVLVDEELGSFAEGLHARCMVRAFLVLGECIFIFALLLAHLAVELVLA